MFPAHLAGALKLCTHLRDRSGVRLTLRVLVPASDVTACVGQDRQLQRREKRNERIIDAQHALGLLKLELEVSKLLSK